MKNSVILLVSRNRIFGVYLKRLIESWGSPAVFTVSEAGEIAEKIRQYTPDLAVIDIQNEEDKDLLELEVLLKENHNIHSVLLIPDELIDILIEDSDEMPFGFVPKPFEENILKISILAALRISKAQRELQAGEEFLSTVLECMKEAVIVIDDAENIVMANPRAEELLSKKISEFIGKNFRDVFVFRDFEEKEGVELITREIPFEGYLVANKNIPVSVNYSQVKGKDFHGWLITMNDISERFQSRKKLEESYKHLEKTLMGTVRTISKIAESRDSYTAEHQQNVAVISAEIAKRLGFSEDRTKWLYIAALLHDVGKVSVPSEILSKPAKLNQFEMELVKLHAENGYQILKDIPFPLEIAEIVRQHHERLDGSGYPRGLKGDEILLEARILAVADVLDAITNHRPYRPALGLNVALDELEKNKGKLYDARVVDACVKALEEGNLVIGSLKENDEPY